MPLDPLRLWWRHDIKVKRRAGAGGRGEYFDPEDTIKGFWDVSVKLVPGDGSETEQSGGLAMFPEGTAPIPVGSKLRCPALTGDAVVTVTELKVADTATGPNHIECVVSG